MTISALTSHPTKRSISPQSITVNQAARRGGMCYSARSSKVSASKSSSVKFPSYFGGR